MVSPYMQSRPRSTFTGHAAYPLGWRFQVESYRNSGEPQNFSGHMGEGGEEMGKNGANIYPRGMSGSGELSEPEISSQRNFKYEE
jgi:hypothetical protein